MQEALQKGKLGISALGPRVTTVSYLFHSWLGWFLTISSDTKSCRIQGDELAVRMREALQIGKLGITALSPRVTTGKEQWQEWHHDFFHNQMRDFIQDDIDLHMNADDMTRTWRSSLCVRKSRLRWRCAAPSRSCTDHKCFKGESYKLFNLSASLQTRIYLTPGYEQAWQ